jgi:serine/threonine protein kinase
MSAPPLPPVCAALTIDALDLPAERRVLGRGKFGTVLACRLRATGEACALKRINKRQLATLQKDVRHEIDMHARISASGAPFCIGLRGWLEDETHVYLVLEHAPGGDLYKRLGKRGVPAALASKWTAQLAQALRACHALGIMHRDLKPENILLTAPDGDIRLADFGWCTDATLTRNHAGTVDYQSPEQVRGDMYDAAVDQWALGLLVYEMLHGRTPFENATISQTLSAILRGNVVFAPVCHDRHAQDLIRTLLQDDPAARLSLDLVLTHPFLIKNA